MKCPKHNCEMAEQTGGGWLIERVGVCQQCAQEKIRAGSLTHGGEMAAKKPPGFGQTAKPNLRYRRGWS
jgi:hypothetical protein